MVTGIDDPVRFPQQLFARKFGDGAEFVIDVGDDAARVGDGDDGVLVERGLEIADLTQRGAQIGFDAPLLGDVSLHAAPDHGPVRKAAGPRAQPPPADLAVLAMERNFHHEIRELARAALFGRAHPPAVPGRDVRVDDFGIGQHVRGLDAGQPFDAGAEIKEAPAAVGRKGVAIDGVVGQAVAQRPQVLLALAQRVLGALALRDVLGGDDEPADRAVEIAPGPHLPFHPLHGAVVARESLALGTFHGAREAAPVHGFPGFADFGKDLVMAVAERRRRELVIVTPARARGEVAHVAVEHRDGRRRIFDEIGELPVAATQVFDFGLEVRRLQVPRREIRRRVPFFARARRAQLAHAVTPRSRHTICRSIHRNQSCRNRRETANGKSRSAVGRVSGKATF